MFSCKVKLLNLIKARIIMHELLFQLFVHLNAGSSVVTQTYV